MRLTRGRCMAGTLALLAVTAGLSARPTPGPQSPPPRSRTFGSRQARDLARRQEALENIPVAEETPAERPRKASDVACAVLGWDAQPPKPSVLLECPPKQIFTPLRIHLKLSWLNPENTFHDYQHTVVELNTPTKLKTTPTGWKVRLKVNRQGRNKWQEKWVTFNLILNMDLEGQ